MNSLHDYLDTLDTCRKHLPPDLLALHAERLDAIEDWVRLIYRAERALHDELYRRAWEPVADVPAGEPV